MNTFYFGVGPDINNLIQEIYVDGKKSKMTNYFIDPEFKDNHDIRIPPSCQKLMKIYGCDMKQFIESEVIPMVLRGTIKLEESLIVSERMIEHIELPDLLTFVFPLFNRLIKNFGCRIEMVFPNIERVVEHLNAYTDYLTHHMCNIEAIAFGGHKVILNPPVILKNFSGVKFDCEDVTIDKKAFYTKLTLNPNYDYEECKHLENEKFSSCVNIPADNYFHLSETIWRLSNESKINCDKDTLYLTSFIDRSKLPSELKYLVNDVSQFDGTYKDVADIVSREGHFKLTDHHQRIELIHPYLSYVTYMKANSKSNE